jgi:hypothetical protein
MACIATALVLLDSNARLSAPRHDNHHPAVTTPRPGVSRFLVGAVMGLFRELCED